MKKVVVCFLILWVVSWLGAEKLAVFTDLMKPDRLAVGKDYIYVGEFPHIHVFARSDASPVKKFGKQGEGPREFNRYCIPRVIGERLLVNSSGKITYFTLEGEFIEEKRVNRQTGSSLLPVGEDRFVARGFTDVEGEQYLTVNLLDGEGKKIKELGRMHRGVRSDRILYMDQQAAYETDGERIYLMLGREFVIDVFDRDGKKLSTITREYKRPSFTEEDKRRALESFRTDPRTKPIFETIKQRIVFPDAWPAVAGIRPDGKTLYIMTFKREKDSYELFILKPDGTLVSRKMVPIQFQTPMRPYPMDMRDGRLYQLVENEDEEWELQAWPL